MEAQLLRTYHREGTNGVLVIHGNTVVFTIELPWKDNQHNISCIPEGRYEIRERWVEKFGTHFILLNVPDRTYILIHPATDALKQLKGCIGPVMEITGPGLGKRSREAVEKLKAIFLEALHQRERIFLTIKTNKL